MRHVAVKLTFFITAWAFTLGSAQDVKRIWNKADGASAELTATHIDGWRLHFVVDGGEKRTLEIASLHEADQLIAFRQCIYKPYEKPDYIVKGKGIYRSISTWDVWLETFSKPDPSGDLLLSEAATAYRKRILQNAKNSAELNNIKIKMMTLNVDAIQKMMATASKERSRNDKIKSIMKPGEEARADKRGYSSFRGEE